MPLHYLLCLCSIQCGVLFFLSFRNNFWMENQQAFLLTNEQNMRRKQLVGLFLPIFNSWKSVLETTKLIFLLLFLIGTWFYYVFCFLLLMTWESSWIPLFWCYCRLSMHNVFIIKLFEKKTFSSDLINHIFI